MVDSGELELDVLCVACGDAGLASDMKTCKGCEIEALCETCIAPSEHDCPCDVVRAAEGEPVVRGARG